jgi:hypothetical protein
MHPKLKFIAGKQKIEGGRNRGARDQEGITFFTSPWIGHVRNFQFKLYMIYLTSDKVALALPVYIPC